MTEQQPDTMDWNAVSLPQLIDALDIPPGASVKEINLYTRALAYTLYKHGWTGDVIARSRTSMISLGGGREEICLQWKDGWINAAGQSFSAKMMTGAPVDVRTVPASQCFPPIARSQHEGTLGKMDAAVQAFVLRITQEPDEARLDAPRPRI